MSDLRRSIYTVTIFAVVLASLAACAAPTGRVTPKPAHSIAEATPKPTPTVDAIRISVACRYTDADYKVIAQQTFATPQRAWAAGQPWNACDGVVSGGTDYTDQQQAAAAAAGYTDISSVKTLYGLCAELDGFYERSGPVNGVQAQEIAGMLTLCPDHPKKTQLLAASAVAQQADAERAAGTRLGPGTYTVGQQIQPGLYRSTAPVEDCFWERLDKAGETIDNNFIPSAPQVQITVEATDFALHVERCGELVKIN